MKVNNEKFNKFLKIGVLSVAALSITAGAIGLQTHMENKATEHKTMCSQLYGKINNVKNELYSGNKTEGFKIERNELLNKLKNFEHQAINKCPSVNTATYG